MTLTGCKRDNRTTGGDSGGCGEGGPEDNNEGRREEGEGLQLVAADATDARCKAAASISNKVVMENISGRDEIRTSTMAVSNEV